MVDTSWTGKDVLLVFWMSLLGGGSTFLLPFMVRPGETAGETLIERVGARGPPPRITCGPSPPGISTERTRHDTNRQLDGTGPPANDDFSENTHVLFTSIMVVC